MDVRERIAAGLPESGEFLEANGHVETAELWLMARAYSRLRHRTSRWNLEGRRRFEILKDQCVRLAVSRDPDLFLVFADPGKSHLVIIYHRVERNLLHVPLAVWNEGAGSLHSLAPARTEPAREAS
jgi:hypothetical protein